VPYEYLAEGVTSDVTFRASGSDLDTLFTAAADATANLMVRRLDSIAATVSIPALVRADALDLLLLRFIEELVFHKDAERLLLRARDVRVERDDGGYRVRATLTGETIDVAKHDLEADVKAVTLHGLAVRHVGDEWRAEVTLDV
jgi:SHS2 domain-containing protein